MEDITAKIKQKEVVDLEKEVLNYTTQFFIGAVILSLFLLLVFSGWLLASKNSAKSLSNKISQVDSQLATLKDLDEEVIAFAGAVSNIQSALNQKKKWSGVFKELNNVTPKDVVLTNFSVDETGKAKIDGYTGSLSSLAKALLAFKKDKENPTKENSVFKNVVLSGLSFAPDKITFSLDMKVVEAK